MRCKTKSEFRTRRHLRLRRKVRGTAERPRMAVFISNHHMYVQFVDDLVGRTLAAASTVTAAVRAAAAPCNVATAQRLGQAAAEVAVKAGIKAVVFDRGGFSYKGRMKALADAARAAGLKF